jgi:ferric-dicitrate binding protein FerR (iron transport regulator)
MESLLFRYVRGNVTDQEIAEVERWIDASPDNRKLVEQLCVVDFANETLQYMHRSKPQLSLSKAKHKIRKNRMHNLAMWMQRAAAILFIPLLCLTAWFSQQPARTPHEQAQMVEITSAPGLVTSVVLPDSTKVWLNANSTIKYPTRFAPNMREVSVTGETYFAVAKNPKKPFYVNVNDAFKVKVLGTEFNVEAFPSASTFSTTLVEGSVELVSAKDSTTSFLTLKPDEQSIWDSNTKKITVQKVNTAVFTSWKDGKIIFKNTPIAEIAASLGKRYNAQFVISPQLKDYRFTGTFTNQQLVQILEHFKISSDIQYEIKGLDLHTDGTASNTIVILK